MIWFACKKCGKRHGRAEALVGTMVFCDCGHGNRVPWSSTVAEPEPEEARPLPPAPSAPARPRPSIPAEPDAPDFPPPRRRREVRRPNPAFCLNHEDDPSAATCADCHASFCAACVVTLQGRTLCGPCKNFRIRRMGRPPRISALAIVGFVLALVGGPVAFVLAFMAIGVQVSNGSTVLAFVFCVVGLAVPAAALVVGALALRQTEGRPDVGGRSLALTAATTGLAASLWILTIAALLVVKEVGG